MLNSLRDHYSRSISNKITVPITFLESHIQVCVASMGQIYLKIGSERFRKVLKGSERFQKVPKGSERFRKASTKPNWKSYIEKKTSQDQFSNLMDLFFHHLSGSVCGWIRTPTEIEIEPVASSLLSILRVSDISLSLGHIE